MNKIALTSAIRLATTTLTEYITAKKTVAEDDPYHGCYVMVRNRHVRCYIDAKTG